ncbi:hypothetical protein [Streptomyces sp. NPDC001880]
MACAITGTVKPAVRYDDTVGARQQPSNFETTTDAVGSQSFAAARGATMSRSGLAWLSPDGQTAV